MRRDLKGKGVLFQVGLLSLFSTAVLAGSTEDSPSLRFGDPETMMEEKSPPLPAPERKKPVTTETVADPAERIRKIIASVPPGSDYPVQLDELVEIGGRGVSTLVGIFEDAAAPWQSRWIAGMALGRLGTLGARQALKKGLTDSLFLVRMASIQALSRMGDASVAPALRKALLDPALVVRSAAVESLERMRDRDSVPDLIKELTSPRNYHRGRSLWIREQIVNALGTLGDQGAIPSLLAVLRENEASLRLSACSALAKISPGAAPAAGRPTDEKCVEKWRQWGIARAEAEKN
jgi:hypothetical protein